MAKIIEHRQIPLDDLVIGKGQARTRDTLKDVDQLAESIEKQGLLQPIVVCEAKQMGKWEILKGQRRFLAHKALKRDTITAAILDQPVDEAEAKAISITATLIRGKLSDHELIDGITFLYKKYGTATMVHEATGIPCDEVRNAIERARTGSKSRQAAVPFTRNAHAALRRYAKDQDLTQDEAAAGLIEDALKGLGLLEA